MQNLFSQIEMQKPAFKQAMKTMPFILFALAMLGLAGCSGTSVLGAAVGGSYLTKRDDGDPPDLSKQMPQHESWCYQTAGDVECSAYPQRDGNGRLIMVDPPSRYPLNERAYHETVIETQQP